MYAPHNRSSLNAQLANLETSVLDLASMVEKAISFSINALKNQNLRLAEQVITNDPTLNARRYQVEEEALTLMTLQQPLLSRDLRYVAAVMHIAGELERMGDYAKGLARISGKLNCTPPTHIMAALEQMATYSNSMLHQSMDAFIEMSEEQAHLIARSDDTLDDLYNQIYHTLLEAMLADRANIDWATLLLWAAHNLERMGDRVTNICERICFVRTGVMSDMPGYHQVGG